MRYLFIPGFGLVYLYATLSWGVPGYVGTVYALASAACFIVYAIDKAAARANRRRTPERTLLLLGLAGGWPGGLLAQQMLRHKSSKPSFQLRFWITVAVNIAAFVYLASPGSVLRLQ
jgi:uncharacterized membrane protein YsdA (DUF1294 family)